MQGGVLRFVPDKGWTGSCVARDRRQDGESGQNCEDGHADHGGTFPCQVSQRIEPETSMIRGCTGGRGWIVSHCTLSYCRRIRGSRVGIGNVYNEVHYDENSRDDDHKNLAEQGSRAQKSNRP